MPNTTAFGFVALEDVFSRELTEVGVDVVRTAITDSVTEYNRQLAAILPFVTVGTTSKEKFRLPGGSSLQPLDQWGNPLPVKGGSSYEAGYPIQGGGTAWGTNRVSRALMTVAEANEHTLDAIKADADWMRRHIMASLLSNVSWTFDDDQYGALTVNPLANGDTVVYPRKGVLNPAADNHYLAQAAAIADVSNPYPALYDELKEHPGNTGPFVAYIASDLVASTVALADFVPLEDSDITEGVGTATISGNRAAVQGPGDLVLGKMRNGLWIVEWYAVPSGYILAMALNSTGGMIFQREYPAAALRGFFPEFDPTIGGLSLNKFIRYAGFGVRNRVAAAVMRIGNASYATPTGYEAPLVG